MTKILVDRSVVEQALAAIVTSYGEDCLSSEALQAALDAKPVEQDVGLVKISEYGEGQENECPVCGAAPGSACAGVDPSDPESGLGVEYGRFVHRARQGVKTQDDLAQEAPVDKLLFQVIYGDFSGDNPQDLDLALAARTAYNAIKTQLTESAARIEALTAENQANMATCRGIIKGLTQERDAAYALMESKGKRLAYLEDAYKMWQDKTDWVQAGVSKGKLPPTMLGKHRADILRELIEGKEKVLDVAQKPLTDEQIEALGHRIATKYTHRSDPASHSYGFVRHTLIDFARAIEKHGIGGEE